MLIMEMKNFECSGCSPPKNQEVKKRKRECKFIQIAQYEINGNTYIK